MYPLPGIDIDRAIEALREVVRTAENLDGVGADQIHVAYLEWIDSAEAELVRNFGPTALAALHSPSFFQISAMDTVRLIATVRAEVTRQSRRLASLAEVLESHRAGLEGEKGSSWSTRISSCISIR
jgi:phosphoglycerate-specific signal transduction histidine kinase